jgi:hypothetical protein
MSIRKRGFCVLAVLCWLGFSVRLLAHDPYEITSTASVFTNGIEVQIEMEFRTALRLAGVEFKPSQVADESFNANRSKLFAVAGGFFQVFAGGNLLAAGDTNVMLGVENHVQFQIHYPPSRFRPLRFVAEGLKPFEGQGPYGTTLTVLDMVNKTVLGQSVLYPDSVKVEIGSTTNATVVSWQEPIHVTAERVVRTNFQDTIVVSAAPAVNHSTRLKVALVIGAVIMMVALICRLARKA